MYRLLLAVGLAGLLAVAARADDKVELRWQLQKGQVLKYLLRHHEVRTIEVADQKLETTTNADYEWQWTVKDIDADGTASIDLKLTALRVDATGKEFSFAYDSTKANDAEGEYNKALKNFYDQLRFTTFRLRLKPDGRVGDVYGFDKLLGETTAGTGVAEFNGYWLRDDSFGWFLQRALGVLPAKAVDRDAKWKLDMPATFKDLATAVGQLDFSLDKPTKAGDSVLEQVKFTGSESADVSMPFGNSTMGGRLKTTKLSGVVRFDPKAGLAEGGEYTADYEGELKFPTGGDKPLVLKTGLKNTVTLERKP